MEQFSSFIACLILSISSASAFAGFGTKLKEAAQEAKVEIKKGVQKTEEKSKELAHEVRDEVREIRVNLKEEFRSESSQPKVTITQQQSAADAPVRQAALSKDYVLENVSLDEIRSAKIIEKDGQRFLELSGVFSVRGCTGGESDPNDFVMYYNTKEGIFQFYYVMRTQFIYTCPSISWEPVYTVTLALPEQESFELRTPSWGWVPVKGQAQGSCFAEEPAVGFYTFKLNRAGNENKVEVVSPILSPLLKNAAKKYTRTACMAQINEKALKKEILDEEEKRNQQLMNEHMKSHQPEYRFVALNPQYSLHEFHLDRFSSFDQDAFKNNQFKAKAVFAGSVECEDSRLISRFNEWEKTLRFFCLKNLPYDQTQPALNKVELEFVHPLHNNVRNEFRIHSSQSNSKSKSAYYEFSLEYQN